MLGLTAAIVSYLVGAFPTAYVLSRRYRGIDVSRNGSGNIGAMNAYEVTGSKYIGISVGAIDMLKGFVTTLAFEANFGLVIGMIAAVSVVAGHNYSVFIGFKGGRGLATAAGSLLVIQPISVAAYLAVYFILRKLRVGLYVASVAGVASGCAFLFAKPGMSAAFEALSAVFILTILSKHMYPLLNELRKT